MPTLSNADLQREYPRMSDEDMVIAFAKAQGYHVAIKKDASSSRSDYGFAFSQSEVNSYLVGSDCPNPKIVYDDGKRESY